MLQQRHICFVRVFSSFVAQKWQYRESENLRLCLTSDRFEV
jgi:hypothetical protein